MDLAIRASAVERAEPCWSRIADDLALFSDGALALEKVEAEMVEALPAVRGGIHLAFKFGIEHGDRIQHGGLLVPLADAITLACLSIMLPREDVAEQRQRSDLDEPVRDALIEVSTWIARSLGASLRTPEGLALRIESESCQGVREGARPAIAHEPDECWVELRARVRLAEWPAFEATLLVPDLEEERRRTRPRVSAASAATS